MNADAWTRIAAGEDATIYAYEVLSAKLSGDLRSAGLDAIHAHRQARDFAHARLALDGQSPDSPASYDLPFDVHDTSAAVSLAITVELRLADQYLFVVAETTGSERRHACESAQESTARATMWGWETAAFPPGAPVATKNGGPESPTPSSTAETAQPDSLLVSPHDGATLQ